MIPAPAARPRHFGPQILPIVPDRVGLYNTLTSPGERRRDPDANSRRSWAAEPDAPETPSIHPRPDPFGTGLMASYLTLMPTAAPSGPGEAKPASERGHPRPE